MMKRTRTRILARLCAAALCIAVLPATALAQDFYGEGNVLIAVDMGPYAENEDVSYPEGTLGTLQWGEDAPTGVSTRPEFNAHSYTVPDDITLPPAPDYAVETVYEVGQKVFFPYLFEGEEMWFSADALPPEVLDADGTPRFLIHHDHVKTENGVTQYLLPAWEEDGEVYPSAAFLEIECAAVTAYSTVWQYTGAAYAGYPDFDPDTFMDAMALTEEEIRFFIDTCDEAYTVQSRVYGDPRWEDMRGDRDGKAAYVALDLSVLEPTVNAYYSDWYTDLAGFDCLVIGANMLPGRSAAREHSVTEDIFTGMLIHELNHYIVRGCIGRGDDNWNIWVCEALAQSAVYAVRPESTEFLYYRGNVTHFSSRLRMIPGMLWSYGGDDNYPFYKEMTYALGPFFLRYIERETSGQADGRLWTNYFAERTPVGSITGEELDGYLTEITGEGLDAWMAQFMAAVIVGADSGPFSMGDATITAQHRVDPFTFFRPWEEYGAGLDFDGAADAAIIDTIVQLYGLFGLSGGGTTYAWRNDAGGNIAVTGAEDRWRFFAVDMDLPGEREVIDIASAEELARIGHDPDYPRSGRYRLTADIDLGGADHPWTPIGNDADPFIGTFDGNGHTIRGLYINDPDSMSQGLFGLIGGAEVRNLTVCGSVTGGTDVGGIVAYLNGGTISGCKSLVTVAGTEECGGIAGGVWHGTIADCTASGTVTASNLKAGGITGIGVNCTISGCYSTCSVSGPDRVGGIAGQMQTDSAMSNCYSAGTVSGGDNTGGVAGRLAYAELADCYSYQPGLPAVGSIYADEDGETATVTACYGRSDAGGEGFLTTAEFGQPSSFAGWDFETVWSLENGVRPVLRSNPETVGTAGRRLPKPPRF